MAQVSPEPLFLMLGFLRFGDSLFLFSIRFLFTLNQAVKTLDLNKSSRLRGPDSKNHTRSEILTLALDAGVRITEVLVLRDRLGWHLVGLNVRRGTTLRALGLPRLTRGFVR
jgi:hypothetical protein